MKGKVLNKFLTGVASVALAVTMLPVSSFAANEEPVDHDPFFAEEGRENDGFITEGTIEPFQELPVIQTADGWWNQVEYMSYDADGKLTYGYSYEYDSKGYQTVKECYYDPDGLDYYWVYSYTDEKRTEGKKYDGKDVYLEKRTYKYNDQGYETERVTFDAQGIETEKETTTYDQTGRKRLVESRYRDGKETSRYEYEYNDKGYTVKETYSSYDYQNQKLEKNSAYGYVYDDNGNTTEYLYYEYIDGVETLVQKTKYIRDEKGRTYRYERFNVQGNTETLNDVEIRTFYDWDDDWEVKSDNYYEADGTTYKHGYEYKYDDKRRRIEYLRTETNGRKYKSVFTYESDKQRNYQYSEETDYRDDVEISYTKYDYDENDNRVKETYYDKKGGNLTGYSTYKYKFFSYDGSSSDPEPVVEPTVYIPEDAKKDVPEGYDMLFRLYNPNSGEHFYTTSRREGNSLVDQGWKYEGPGWIAPKEGAPVYRLYNKNSGDHHYTMSKREKDKLVEIGWTYEDIGWYSESKETGKPLYRLYNPNATGAGSHHYTSSTRERKNLVAIGWQDEDVAWYGYAE